VSAGTLLDMGDSTVTALGFVVGAEQVVADVHDGSSGIACPARPFG
jgi:hypothetical protein